MTYEIFFWVIPKIHTKKVLGSGVYNFNGDLLYDGEWSYGKMNGKGRLTKNGEVVCEGIWNSGEFTKVLD